MNNLFPMLLGGFLVGLGVLAGAAADRIRGRHLERAPRAASPAPARTPAAAPKLDPAAFVPGLAPGEDADRADVIAALVGAGYKKGTAAQAVDGCTAREKGSIEDWTAAALRRCVKGVAS